MTASERIREARSNETRQVVKLTVEFFIDAESIRDAEKRLDAWLAPQEDDDALVQYGTAGSCWTWV